MPRDHEDKDLAAAGIKQYWYREEHQQSTKRKDSSASVRASAKIDEETYTKVKEDMSADTFDSKTAQKKRKPAADKPIKPQIPEEFKQQAKLWKDELAKSKKAVDSYRKDIDVGEYCKKIEAKPAWGKAAAKHLQHEADKIAVKVEDLAKEWLAMFGKRVPEHTEEAEIGV